MKNNIFIDDSLNMSFLERGYVVVRPGLDNALKDLRHQYFEKFHWDSDLEFQSTMHSVDSEHRANVNASMKVVLEQISELYLKDYKFLFGNYLLKKHGGSHEVGVHQDWNYVDEEKYVSVNVWFALQPTCHLNGALSVLPGSHKLKTPKRHTPYKSPSFEKVFGKVKSEALELNMDLGEVVIYHPGLFHFSSQNVSQEDRLACASVLIPAESQPIHYHMNEDKEEGYIEEYRAPSEFFNEYQLNEKPDSKYFNRDVPFDNSYFLEIDFDKILQQHKEGANL